MTQSRWTTRAGRSLPQAAPEPVRQLRLVVETDDVEAAAAFYRGVLGMPEQAAFQGAEGARIVMLDAGRATLELVNPAQRRMIDDVEAGGARSDVLRVALEVGDVHAATAAARAGGAEELAPPTVTPWRSVNSRLRAPAGLQVTLFQELGFRRSGGVRARLAGAAASARRRFS